MTGDTFVLPVDIISTDLSTVLVIPNKAATEKISVVSASPIIPLDCRYTDREPIMIAQNLVE